MMSARRPRGVWVARWVVISLAAVAASTGVAIPAGASSGGHLGAGSLANVVALADSGNSSVCALLSSRKVDCWGANDSGQLGNGTTQGSDVPVAVLGLSGVKEVAADINGGSFCAVLSTGHLKCWGYNGDGELGNGTTTTFTVPVTVKNISTATKVFGGHDAFCALLSSKHLDCWGYGSTGQLGDGAASNSDVPVAVHDISDARTVISGYNAFCALLSTSHVDCWGSNNFGELGNGSANGSDVPVAVSKITNALAVAGSGASSVCAVLSSGKVDCWGYNYYGQLGNGTKTNSDVPVAVLGLSGVRAVAEDNSGSSFCARLATGHLKCWGYNNFGELGNGTTTTYTVPVAVKKISTAITVFGGGAVFCARLSDNHLDCWGDGNSGQLGDGSYAISAVPAAVRSIGNATTMISGNAAFCTLLSTTHVDCWGYGPAGQLGDGSTNSSDVPVAVKAAG